MITGQTLRDAILSGANNIANQRTQIGRASCRERV